MASTSTERQPHAVLDPASRRLKAIKIERLLSLGDDNRRLAVLEVGAGSGGISHYFATHPSGRYDVHAVDVCDLRVTPGPYAFSLVDGTRLPFTAGSFDVVISNHVIEHVGDPSVQVEHLQELRRVLRDDGVLYLAVPSRWMLVEPHYRLAFLSWLPERWRSPWLRLWRRGAYYDCRPLSKRVIERMLADNSFEFCQQHRSALLLTFEIERPGSFLYRYVLQRLPGFVYQLLGGAFPTLIYLATKSRK